MNVGDLVRHTKPESKPLHDERGPFVVADIREVRRAFEPSFTQVRAEDPNDPRAFIVDKIDFFELEEGHQ